MLEIHDELTTDDARMARSYLRRIAGAVLLLVAAACTAVHVTKAYGQQISEQGCVYAADVAITSRALSAAGIDRQLAEQILLSMYTSPDPLAQRLRVRVTDGAYASKFSPKDYSVFIYSACIAADGQIDKFLGIGI